jgi:pimeloyl-ACP methyl ester carboxylesterase
MALIETFKQPGVLPQTLAYYRQLFTPPPEAEAQALEARANGPIAVPTLYLHGEEDGCMSARLSDDMAAAFTKGFERVVMPGVGHFLHLEKPEAVLGHILPFLKS